MKSYLLVNMGLVEIGTSLYRFPLFIVFGELWLLRPGIKWSFSKWISSEVLQSLTQSIWWKVIPGKCPKRIRLHLLWLLVDTIGLDRMLIVAAIQRVHAVPANSQTSPLRSFLSRIFFTCYKLQPPTHSINWHLYVSIRVILHSFPAPFVLWSVN